MGKDVTRRPQKKDEPFYQTDVQQVSPQTEQAVVQGSSE